MFVFFCYVLCICCILISCLYLLFFFFYVFFFKQKTAYEMRISDWSSDVCSSDLFDGRWPSLNCVSLALPPACHPLRPAFHVWRSEERRAGKECVSTCRSRWSPYH